MSYGEGNTWVGDEENYEENYKGSNSSTVGSRSRSSSINSRSRSSSNANIEYSIVEEKQKPYAVDMFVKYDTGNGFAVGEIKEVNKIEEGMYGYTLKDGTTIPHSSIISVSTHRILEGGRRRLRRRKSIRRKRATRRQTRRG